MRFTGLVFVLLAVVLAVSAQGSSSGEAGSSSTSGYYTGDQPLSASTLRLVEGNCSDSARLTCALAFGYAESVCPVPGPQVDPTDPCYGAASSCCPTLDFSSTSVDPAVSEFVIDSDHNPFAPLGLAISGQATVRYDGSNRVLHLRAGDTLTLTAPMTKPLCLFSVSSRILGAGRLRVLGAGHSFDAASTAAEAFYTTHEMLLCQAPEISFVNQGLSDVYVQLIELCLIGAHEDQNGVCNGAAGSGNSGSNGGGGDDTPVVPTPPPVNGKDTYNPRRPVYPRVACTRRMGNRTCLTVFGWKNRNNDYVIIPTSEHNGFGKQPLLYASDTPTIFGFNYEDTKYAFYVKWHCSEKNQLLRWTLNTPTRRNGLQRHSVYGDWTLDDSCKDSWIIKAGGASELELPDSAGKRQQHTETPATTQA
jgi:hypothetical protein